MKKIFLYFIICCLISSSCNKDFLDKAPGVDLTENNVFLNRASLETFMATVYRYSVHSNFRYRNQGDLPFSQVNGTDCIHPSSSISDEGDASEAAFVNNNRWNEGTVLPATICFL